MSHEENVLDQAKRYGREQVRLLRGMIAELQVRGATEGEISELNTWIEKLEEASR